LEENVVVIFHNILSKVCYSSIIIKEMVVTVESIKQRVRSNFR
jgi:hypothetical protein